MANANERTMSIIDQLAEIFTVCRNGEKQRKKGEGSYFEVADGLHHKESTNILYIVCVEDTASVRQC